MSDYGDDDPYKVERGYKTDSYILAVQGNPVLIQPIPPEDAQPSTSSAKRPKVRQSIEKIGPGREVYEAYIVSNGFKRIYNIRSG
jgi:hypothetical protein